MTEDSDLDPQILEDEITVEELDLEDAPLLEAELEKAKKEIDELKKLVMKLTEEKAEPEPEPEVKDELTMDKFEKMLDEMLDEKLKVPTRKAVAPEEKTDKFELSDVTSKKLEKLKEEDPEGYKMIMNDGLRRIFKRTIPYM